MLRLIPLLTLVLVFPLELSGQVGDQKAGNRWLVVWNFGRAAGANAGGQIETAMRQQGFDDRDHCIIFCSGDDSSRPRSYSGGGHSASISYRHPKGAGATVSIGSLELGTTSGYEITGTDFLFGFETGNRINVTYGVTTLAPTLALSLGPFSAEAGPAVHRIYSETDFGSGSRESETRVGAIAGAGLSIPLPWRLSIELRGQYRHVGTADIGPFTVGGREFSTHDVEFSHSYFGLGLGLRL